MADAAENGMSLENGYAVKLGVLVKALVTVADIVGRKCERRLE